MRREQRVDRTQHGGVAYSRCGQRHGYARPRCKVDADERWHAQQKGRFIADGKYELQLPFGNARELLMDVLRFGPDAEIISPVSLREEMKQLLTLALTGYSAGR